MYRKEIRIHFVGIGGIGMSGIAKVLKHQGYTVSGCDTDLSQKTILDLQNLDCPIFQQNSKHHCPLDLNDIVVFSSAIKTTAPDIVYAKNLNIPIISRALMLAELMRTKYSIAVAGSHGKTTTTSLIAHIMLQAQLDPTVIVGGHLQAISSTATHGNGEFLVAEADESDRSLLSLKSTFAIVTNIDLEHLETYTDIEDIKQTFKQFLHNLPFYGLAVVCYDDENIRSILPVEHVKIATYGFSSQADFHIKNLSLQKDCSHFDIFHSSSHTFLGSVTTAMPGKHNALNTLAAIVLTYSIGVPFSVISNACHSFQGVDRRFTYRGTYLHAEVFDDYGHHPREIEATIQTALLRKKNRLIVLFQPHRYSRTYHLWNEFITTFSNNTIDMLLITDIYSANESPLEGISSKNLVNAINQQKNRPTIYLPLDDNFKSIQRYLTQHMQPDDLLLILGAGKITHLSTLLTKS